MYGTIRKGDMTIDVLYRKILRIGRRANYRPEELRRKFLDALPLLWLEKAEDIGEHLLLDELAKKLYEIELRRIARHKRDRIPDPLVSNQASQEIYKPLPISASQQQGISLEDMQKAIQALVKKVTELQSQMTQQAQVPASQTVEPVRQLKGPPSLLKTEEGLKNYYVAEYLKEVGLLNKEDLDSDYPIKPFQRSRPQRSNVSNRIDRVEEGINETRDAVNQLTNQFKKLNIHKCDICGETGHSKGSCPNRQIARSNFNQTYFKPLTPINFQNTPPDSDNDKDNSGGYDKVDNAWYYAPEKKNRR